MNLLGVLSQEPYYTFVGTLNWISWVYFRRYPTSWMNITIEFIMSTFVGTLHIGWILLISWVYFHRYPTSSIKIAFSMMYKKLYYMMGARAESIVKKLEILYGLLSQVPYILDEYYFYRGSQVVWTPKIFAQNTTWKYFYTQNSKNPYPQKNLDFHGCNSPTWHQILKPIRMLVHWFLWWPVRYIPKLQSI